MYGYVINYRLVGAEVLNIDAIVVRIYERDVSDVLNSMVRKSDLVR